MTVATASPKLTLLWWLNFAQRGERSSSAQIAALGLGALLVRRVGGDSLAVDARDVEQAFVEAIQLNDEQLRRRARSGWEQFFGHKLKDVRESPRRERGRRSHDG